MKKSEFVLSRSKRVTNLFFNFWLWLDGKARERQSFKNIVCDNLGVIDTLGSQSSTTKYTYDYHEELGSLYGINLLFGWVIEYRNYCGDNELVMFKNRTKKK